MTTNRPVRVLAIQLDGDGDVLLAGPAVRALATTYDRVDLLVSGSGLQAAELLPGVTEILRFDPPWSGENPPQVSTEAVLDLVAGLVARRYQLAVIFTPSHQSPLPMALLARLGGVRRIVAASDDHPGSLLDVRHRRPPDLHEVEAGLDLAHQAGARLPVGDDGRLAVRHPLPTAPLPTEHPLNVRPAWGRRSVVVHPGASASARALPTDMARAVTARLARDGWDVLVTGSAAESDLTAHVAGGLATDLGGRTDLAQLAAVLESAACAVVGNSGPAHLAAAVGTPVASLFAPVVALDRWAPYGVPRLVLGDQGAACRGTQARACPVPGHPCLASVTPDQVSDAVARLAHLAPPATAGVRGPRIAG